MPTTTDNPYKTSEFYIIRVSIEASGPETEGVIMYKSIMVSNHERTGAVIRSAMMKHGLEGSPDNYTLSQLLPDKGLSIRIMQCSFSLVLLSYNAIGFIFVILKFFFSIFQN